MSNLLRKAARQKAKLRVGVSGPSGSGKTYSALLIAKGIASAMDKVAIIDTENGSADLYSHLGEYNVLPLQAPYSPENYIKAIQECENAGMEVVIIDSVTHEWDGKGGCLELNDLIAKTKFKGNTWSAWSETTPRQQKFIEAITTSKLHIITTARAKTETVMTDDKKVKKLGMKEIQREGFEYELTLNFTIDREGHYATASKDRTEIFIDKDPFVISEKTGNILKEWAENGVEVIVPPTPIDYAPIKAKIKVAMKGLEVEPKTFTEATTVIKGMTGLEYKEENYEKILAKLEKLLAERTGAALTPEQNNEQQS